MLKVEWFRQLLVHVGGCAGGAALNCQTQRGEQMREVSRGK